MSPFKKFVDAAVAACSQKFEHKLARALKRDRVGECVRLIEKKLYPVTAEHISTVLSEAIAKGKAATVVRVFEALSGHPDVAALVFNTVETASRSFTKENGAFITGLGELVDYVRGCVKDSRMLDAYRSSYRAVTGSFPPASTGYRRPREWAQRLAGSCSNSTLTAV